MDRRKDQHPADYDDPSQRERAELEDQHLQERKGGYEPASNANAKMATTFLSVKYHVVGTSDPTTKVNG